MPLGYRVHFRLVVYLHLDPVKRYASLIKVLYRRPRLGGVGGKLSVQSLIQKGVTLGRPSITSRLTEFFDIFSNSTILTRAAKGSSGKVK